MKVMSKGLHVVAGTNAGNINIWDAQSGQLIAEAAAHHQAINHLSIAADDSLVATGSADGTVKLWIIGDLIEATKNKYADYSNDEAIEKNLKMEAEPIVQYTEGHNNEITGVIINEFSNRLYTCSEDKT